MRASLDELFVRYWEGTLSPDQAADLEARLAADPRAAAEFRALCLQAVVMAEAVAAPAPAPPRRRWRGAAAAGLLAAAALLTWGDPPGSVRLVRASGLVRLGPAAVAAGRAISAGETVSTVGLAASAVLAYPDGTEVTLTGDAEARVGGRSRRLEVIQGAVRAEVPADGFVLATPEASAAAGPGTRLTVCRLTTQTEVGVAAGRVQLTDPGGDPLGDMGEGEVMTVDPVGAAQRTAADLPETYSWRLARPLPVGWEKGVLADDPLARPFGRAVAPSLWFDFHIGRRCWQVRSESRWVRGLFGVFPDSVARVRYKVDRAGPGQLLAVVRPTSPLSLTDCNVLLAPLPFEPAADGGWREAVLPLAGWAVEPKAWRRPPGPMPWAAFLVVFNTYEQDLGLRVAEFSVGRGRAP
jgi:ferric-dicitrate binding protein FerR (iron transport regulator)